MPKLDYFPPDHPIQRVRPDLRARLYAAQRNHLHQTFGSAGALVEAVFHGLHIAVVPPAALYDEPVTRVADAPHRALVDGFTEMLSSAGVTATALGLQAQACARDLQLLRAFEDPSEVMRAIEEKVAKIVETFPQSAEDLECGQNPGDVIDPFAISAAQVLMFGGEFDQAIGAAVSHKALMIVEDLLGHLHEDVIGAMRGNVRAPEPRGKEQEDMHPITNPFPGADILQPPFEAGAPLRFHQVKNKTGSAKGGDGKRLGDQLNRLREVYGGEVFYDALIGTTLRGHRSRAGVERAAADVVVLVGAAAFVELTRSRVGPELLLRMYQAAFEAVSRRTGYSIPTVVATVVAAFRERAERHGDDLLGVILNDVTSGQPEEQDNRLWRQSPRTNRKRAKRKPRRGS